MGDLREYFFKVFSLDCQQAIFVGIPQTSGLPVIENEGGLVGPTGWHQGQCLTIDLAAVHSRQIYQGSITYSYWLGTYRAV